MLTVSSRLRETRNNESGFTTAELLGNAALGIIALVAIWAALGEMGGKVVTSISDKLGI